MDRSRAFPTRIVRVVVLHLARSRVSLLIFRACFPRATYLMLLRRMGGRP